MVPQIQSGPPEEKAVRLTKEEYYIAAMDDEFDVRELVERIRVVLNQDVA